MTRLRILACLFPWSAPGPYPFLPTLSQKIKRQTLSTKDQEAESSDVGTEGWCAMVKFRGRACLILTATFAVFALAEQAFADPILVAKEGRARHRSEGTKEDFHVILKSS